MHNRPGRRLSRGGNEELAIRASGPRGERSWVAGGVWQFWHTPPREVTAHPGIRTLPCGAHRFDQKRHESAQHRRAHLHHFGEHEEHHEAAKCVECGNAHPGRQLWRTLGCSSTAGARGTKGCSEIKGGALRLASATPGWGVASGNTRCCAASLHGNPRHATATPAIAASIA